MPRHNSALYWKIFTCDSKSQCSHMWVHWLKNCAIAFNLHDKLFYSVATIVVFNNDFYCHIWENWIIKRTSPSFAVSYRLFVFFNNANTVSAEMWVWGFGNHAWYKSLVKSLVFDSWLETFVSLVISKTPYSHFLLTVSLHLKMKTIQMNQNSIIDVLFLTDSLVMIQRAINKQVR